MRTIHWTIALSLFAAGCGTDGPAEMMMMEEEDDGLLPGFEVEEPLPGEEQFRTPILQEFAPGEDVTLCTYLDYTVPEDFDVVHFRGFQSAQGHHAILYGASEPMPVGTHVCGEADMYNTHFLGGAGDADGAGEFDLPHGIAFRVHTGTQLMIQTHWINFSDTPVKGQAAFNIRRQPPSAEIDPSDLFANVTTQIALQPGAGTARSVCQVEDPMRFFLLAGHAHEWGTHITITHEPAEGDPVVIYDESWSAEKVFNPTMLWYTKEQPFQMEAGDRMVVDCTYDNTTSAPIYFPSEMCVAFGYYFPATKQLNCVDSVWPGP